MTAAVPLSRVPKKNQCSSVLSVHLLVKTLKCSHLSHFSPSVMSIYPTMSCLRFLAALVHASQEVCRDPGRESSPLVSSVCPETTPPVGETVLLFLRATGLVLFAPQCGGLGSDGEERYEEEHITGPSLATAGREVG